jgi:dCTP deaminase
MILNGDEIINAMIEGLIGIEPWDDKRVGPNSYDVTLDPTIKRYTAAILDHKCNNAMITESIPGSGLVLNCGEFILGSTSEYCNNYANCLVPMIEGRSSIARLGIQTHCAAGFGDLGFCGKWTLEITAACKVRLYPFMPIAQLYWIRTSPTNRKYTGKYQNQNGAVTSRLFIDE